MTKIQVVENENLLQYADFVNCEVWLLNRTNNDELDPRIVNIAEVTESLLPSSIKFPQLLTHIYEKHPGITTYDPEGKVIDYEPGFDYEILTNNKENFSIHAYVCDKEKIKEVI